MAPVTLPVTLPVSAVPHDCSAHKHVKDASAKTKADASVVLDDGVTLTTYPEDSSPLGLTWGAAAPEVRGPVVCSRYHDGLAKHNAIGAHSGPYCVYHALAVGSKQLDPNHVADYTNSQPAFSIPEQKAWYTETDIVAMDPLGHLTPFIFDETAKAENVQIRPSISVTKASLQLFELKDAVANNRMKVDGKIVLNRNGDVAVSKVAVEPVWYLPGVAQRFGITENELRKALFQDTNGMYPELITRPDIKVFLPPVGGLTVYIFGDPAYVSDPTKKVALRVHDECNGSDVFGSDICTCRPYLMFGIEEAVREAQNGGSGVVIYFRKEGRALGEVTKYLVYNARKRGGDTADEYFHRTECIAGVRDMRFQQLMPDILKWLGITKIDRMLSMSNMKHDAIVEQGIPIIERVPIPDELVPPDSRVEIDAKINAGYFTTGKVMTEAELKAVQGRTWNDVV
ncbi:LAME_0E04302g1_1 [Lachancea meyersii CBS 8951]|uniref:LAME_0E04302g1_1 n=1 Tax=Lachancea meyersii CBS 8951 TaxID=1266667 RepID=A0A1G4JGU4_9SACH|nr:LAME_0E04302g1_1 [Lachancea meyersii CBS 8951]